MLSVLVAASLLMDWKTEVSQEATSPLLKGKILEVCVDDDCVTYDRSSEYVAPAWKGGGLVGRPGLTNVPAVKMYGSSVVNPPISTSEIEEIKPVLKPTLDTGPGGGFREMLRDVIAGSGVRAEIDVTYKENSKGPGGIESSREIRVKISGSTGQQP